MTDAELEFSCIRSLKCTVVCLLLFLIAFSLLEKRDKENYIIGLTNAKTKKLSL